MKELLEKHKNLSVAEFLELVNKNEQDLKSRYVEFENSYFSYKVDTRDIYDSGIKIIKTGTIPNEGCFENGCYLTGEVICIKNHAIYKEVSFFKNFTLEKLVNLKRLTKEQYDKYDEACKRINKELRQLQK